MIWIIFKIDDDSWLFYNSTGPIGFNEEEKRLEGISSDEYLNSRVDDFRGLQFNRIFSETCS